MPFGSWKNTWNSAWPFARRWLNGIPSFLSFSSIGRNPVARNAMWSMAPVPCPDPCEVRPRYFFWISPAIFALGPMCTTSTSPRYIQCTGKPKSGCGPDFMPSTRAYQSRVASRSSAAMRKCSMCEIGIALIYIGRRKHGRRRVLHCGIEAPDDGRREENDGHGARQGRGVEDRRHRRDRRRRRQYHAARAHGGRPFPHRAFGDHQGRVRRLQSPPHQFARRRRPVARRRARDRPRARRGPRELDRDGRRLPGHLRRRVCRRHWRRRRQLGARSGARAGGGGVHRSQGGMKGRLKVGCLGMGWWSDVLADAMQRSGKFDILSCYTRSAEKRKKFADKYDCTAVESYEEMLQDKSIEAIVNTTPNATHLETTCAAAEAGKHVFLDKPIANTVADGRAIAQACRKAKVVLALGYQRRRESHFRFVKQEIDAGRFGKLVNAEANISRDRLGKIDLSSWRYTAEGMPGGVMLQIGIHYSDVLEYLLGPVKAVTGQFARLVLPGDNPDVASLILEHEGGALSTLNASYASASEYYLMNIYGKERSAYYDMHGGLRILKRGETKANGVACAENDTIVEELEEFMRACRGDGEPEMDGEKSTASLAVILAGIKSAREGRRVTVAEMLA